ncbi:hypothetical protein ACNKHR_12160 [Shigella flexneri]
MLVVDFLRQDSKAWLFFLSSARSLLAC